MTTAKVFWSGRSQAIRLPKEFRFNTSQVTIKKKGNAILLEPSPDNWDWLDTIEIEDICEAEELPMQERPLLKKLFP